MFWADAMATPATSAAVLSSNLFRIWMVLSFRLSRCCRRPPGESPPSDQTSSTCGKHTYIGGRSVFHECLNRIFHVAVPRCRCDAMVQESNAFEEPQVVTCIETRSRGVRDCDPRPRPKAATQGRDPRLRPVSAEARFAVKSSGALKVRERGRFEMRALAVGLAGT